jgi:hypothetical protein
MTGADRWYCSCRRRRRIHLTNCGTCPPSQMPRRVCLETCRTRHYSRSQPQNSALPPAMYSSLRPVSHRAALLWCPPPKYDLSTRATALAPIAVPPTRRCPCRNRTVVSRTTYCGIQRTNAQSAYTSCRDAFIAHLQFFGSHASIFRESQPRKQTLLSL